MPEGVHESCPLTSHTVLPAEPMNAATHLNLLPAVRAGISLVLQAFFVSEVPFFQQSAGLLVKAKLCSLSLLASITPVAEAA